MSTLISAGDHVVAFDRDGKRVTQIRGVVQKVEDGNVTIVYGRRMCVVPAKTLKQGSRSWARTGACIERHVQPLLEKFRAMPLPAAAAQPRWQPDEWHDDTEDEPWQ